MAMPTSVGNDALRGGLDVRQPAGAVALGVVLEHELPAVAHEESVHLRERGGSRARGRVIGLRNDRRRGHRRGRDAHQPSEKHGRSHPVMIIVLSAMIPHASATIALGVTLIILGLAGYFLTGH